MDQNLAAEGSLDVSCVTLITFHVFPHLADLGIRMLKLQSVHFRLKCPGGSLADDRMTLSTLIRDRPSARTLVCTVMAAEASRENKMPDIVGVFLPGDVHLREKVRLVDANNGLARFLDRFPPLRPNLGIFHFIESGDRFPDLLCRLLFGRVFPRQNLNRFMLDRRES